VAPWGAGVSIAIGYALASRMKGVPGRTYCILGDGESQEGQVWEAALRPPCNRHLDLPLIAAYWQGAPGRVFAPQRRPGQSGPKRVALPDSTSGRRQTEFTVLLRH